MMIYAIDKFHPEHLSLVENTVCSLSSFIHVRNCQILPQGVVAVRHDVFVVCLVINHCPGIVGYDGYQDS